ncbi:MAG: ATP-binding protein [Lysobacteraceae bacterium]
MIPGRTQSASAGNEATVEPLRRELYFFTLFRLLEAALLLLVTYGQFGLGVTLSLNEPGLALRLAALVYTAIAVLLFLSGREPRFGLRRQAAVGLGIDILMALFAMHELDGLDSGIALLLVVNIGAGALLMPLRAGLTFASIAGIGVIGVYLLARYGDTGAVGNLPESVMFAVTYLAIAVFCQLLGRQMRESQALAEQRGAEVANLSLLNETIIRRMRTGVMVVDSGKRIHLINEAAWALLGNPSPDQKDLEEVAPELCRQLYHWRNEEDYESTPVQLHEESPEVLPRFARLTVSDDLFLVFLDDSSMVSRRAEQLTLSTLGRLSASIAHEIRNPLAAISYSSQLLEESPDLAETDQRLVEIIRNHCDRMNGIVENILNLAHRERSRPEALDLSRWVHDFVDEFKESRFLEDNEIRALAQSRHLLAMVDQQQLHQVVSNLVMNALNHGKLPGEPARITVVARQIHAGGAPIVEVIDRGPGIPARVVDHIFDPFYTTSEHGTGLGLYLSRQLCETNQATLEYVSVAGGGSCFRIALMRPRSIGESSPQSTA